VYFEIRYRKRGTRQEPEVEGRLRATRNPDTGALGLGLWAVGFRKVDPYKIDARVGVEVDRQVQGQDTSESRFWLPRLD
jgi:hypothetical protein